jgi:GNAT superfamily N-acetyltransferase
MPCEIRRADIQDAEALLPLVAAYRAHMGYAGEASGFCHRLLTEPSTCAVFLAWQATRAVGFVLTSESISTRRLGRAVVIEDLWVDPLCRGGGIGTELFRHAVDWATTTGARTIMGVVDERDRQLCAFYGRFGFHPRPLLVLQDDVSTAEAGK